MLPILLKFLIPFIVIYAVVRIILKTVRQIAIGFRGGQEVDSKQGRSSPTDQVIEICPECGNVKSGRHRCP